MDSHAGRSAIPRLDLQPPIENNLLAPRIPTLQIPLATRTMSNKAEATAKDAEGKLESALGELTGDTGHQLMGKAKQVQASAMNAAEDLKDGARAMAQKVSDAAAKLADGQD
jgi:uncharacterized protein YjbJ (UPF0337 family)